jgi:regulator of chromosome condensation
MGDANGLAERAERQLTIEDDRLNSPDQDATSTLLYVYVFGTGEGGELGLGTQTRGKNRPELAPKPRPNPYLNSEENPVVQISVGGMHSAALTAHGDVLTWGVNDSKALGRDTEWDGDEDLNPQESTPQPVQGLEEVGVITQVAVSDNATFVLNEAGLVFGWGSFFVRVAFLPLQLFFFSLLTM